MLRQLVDLMLRERQPLRQSVYVDHFPHDLPENKKASPTTVRLATWKVPSLAYLFGFKCSCKVELIIACASQDLNVARVGTGDLDLLSRLETENYRTIARR